MNKGEKLSNIIREGKTTISLRIKYFFFFRKLKKFAKEGYYSYSCYDELEPWIVDKLTNEGIKVKNKKDENGQKYRTVIWHTDKKKQ